MAERLAGSDTAPLAAEAATAEGRPLLSSKKFLCLMAAAFLAYANISVFFGFYDYLKTLPVDPADYGILIGALAAVALAVRPAISPFFTDRNARRFLFLGTVLSVGALAAYSAATGFWSLLSVRILHGLSFAVMGTALMTLIVGVIPSDRSAQFFGYLAVVVLIPNTMIPPLLPLLERLLGGFTQILLLFSALTLLMFPLVSAATGKTGVKSGEASSPGLSRREVFTDLKDPVVLRMLAAMLLLYCGHAMIFFFLDGYGRIIGVAYAGFFLTLSTMGEIGVRVAAGSIFDKTDKRRLAAWTLAGLGAAYALLALEPAKAVFFGLGLVFGVGWGVVMPVFNGLMFDESAPRLRSFNINLGLQMFQAGFFLGPIVGAHVLALWGYPVLYSLCGAMSLAAAALMTVRTPRRRD